MSIHGPGTGRKGRAKPRDEPCVVAGIRLGGDASPYPRYLFILSLVFFGLLLPASAAERPNILMIVLDDLNDYLGVMGGHPQTRTPNMDRLAAQGVLFRNAHSNVAVCSPSRASFMTGVLPTTSECWGFDNWLENETLRHCKTLAEYARDNGYKAYQTGKVLHTKRKGAWDELGVPSEYGPLAYNGVKPARHPSCPEQMAELGPLDSTFAPLSDVPSVPATADTPGYTGWWNSRWDAKGPFRYVNAQDRDLLTDEKSAAWVRNKITALDADEQVDPFFIAMGLIRPHTPLVVPKKYYDLFPLADTQLPVIKPDDISDVPFGDDSRGRQALEGLRSGYDDPDEGLRRYVRAYLASVAFADTMVGEALSALEASSFRDNTIVMLFSDHGYNMGEKEYLFKYCLWEESTRVPLIIRDPRYARNAGKIVDHPVSLVDIFPTVRDLCGWTGPTRISEQGAPLDGHSLRPFLADPDTDNWDGPDVALSVVASWKSKKPEEQHLSVRSRDFRYTRYFDQGEELYDHRSDPYEWHNLADNPEYEQVRSVLSRQMFALIEEAANRPASAPPTAAPKTSGAAAWKDQYFGWHPDADTNEDGVLSWPEYHAHKKASEASP